MCCTRLAEILDAKIRQKIAICAPSHNFVRLYRRNQGIYRQSEKKLVKQQYLLHMSRYGELRPTSDWERLASLRRPGKLRFVTAPTSLNGGQPNFARCLAVSCAGTLFIHFWRLLPPISIILPRAIFTLRPSLAFSHIGSVTERHSSSGRNFAAWYKEWNYGTFAPRNVQQRAPPVFRGRSSRWA